MEYGNIFRKEKNLFQSKIISGQMIIKTRAIDKDRYKSNKVIANSSLLCLILISANLYLIRLTRVID